MEAMDSVWPYKGVFKSTYRKHDTLIKITATCYFNTLIVRPFVPKYLENDMLIGKKIVYISFGLELWKNFR